MSNKNIQLPQLWVVNVKEGAGDSEPPKKGGGNTPLSLSEVYSYIPPPFLSRRVHYVWECNTPPLPPPLPLSASPPQEWSDFEEKNAALSMLCQIVVRSQCQNCMA